MKREVFIVFLFLLLGVTASYAKGAVQLSDIQAAIIEGNYQKAYDQAKVFIKQNPSKSQSDQAQYYLGLSLLWLDKPAQAEEIFHTLTMYDPDKELLDRTYIGIIDAHYMEEHYQESIAEAQDLLKRSPNSEFLSLVYLKLARAHLKLAQWDIARDYLNRIIKNYPNSPEVHSAKQLLEEKQYFAVQVGSFLEADRAKKLADELQQRGEYAYIVQTTDKSGRMFYRVRVGNFSFLNEAQSLKKKLSKQGYPTQIYP